MRLPIKSLRGSAFITPYNYREYVVFNGVVPYTCYAFVSSLLQGGELNAEERKTVESYLDDMPR